MGDRSSVVTDDFSATWAGIRGLLAATDALDLPFLGHCRHFHVRLDGRITKQGDDFLLCGTLLQGWALDGQPASAAQQAKVVVRMRAVDYYTPWASIARWLVSCILP